MNHDYPLPKWPQMRVAGRSVSPERALEIIRRTDNFFKYPSGNNKVWIKFVYDTVGIPYINYDMDEDWYSCDKKIRAFHERWNYVSTEYVINDWISCAFIYGPHGWIHPDGNIYFSDNVGKWPSSQELIDEWKIIATNFDDLELDVVFMSGEDADPDKHQVFGIEVRKGNVEIFGPDHTFFTEFHWEDPDAHTESRLEKFIKDGGFVNFRSETAIPFDIIEKWAKENK